MLPLPQWVGLDPRSNSPEYKATSTGLGERVQLASPEVDLETHITDVVHLIAFEDLHEVVLLGHACGYRRGHRCQMVSAR